MARSVATSVENNFSRGLVTEVTGVNSPENSVVETHNVVYDRRGRAATRKGFAFEDGNVPRNIVTSGVRNEFVWETVSDNTGKTFVVTQFGVNIHFFEVSGDQSLSSGLQSFDINLASYKVGVFSDVTVSENLCSFTSGKGYLFIAHPNCDTLYVKYDDTTGTISVSRINIQIRDFEGVEDGLRLDERPTSLSNSHRYNLLNQGWYANAQNALNKDYDISPVLEQWQYFGRTDWPSNSDVWWYYTTVVTSGDAGGTEGYNGGIVDAKTGLYGNTPAAKGHYIINALQTNRSELSGVSVEESSSNGYRPSVVAFFTGRAFYAGVGKSGFSSTIYFTQIIEDDEQLGKCYQANDPTSRESFDLLASDGGTIKIQDINTILDMRVLGESLYIFASNGVWAVTGTNEGPFKATDYTVSKVSSFPAASKTSIVDVGGLPIWWNYEGIFSLQKSQAGLSTEVTNLSQTTIQSFYDEIPQISKLTAKGAFNDQTGLVYWLYNTSPQDGTYKYTHILVFDVLSTAFYPLTIPDSSNHISGVVPVRSVGPNYIQEVVTASGGSVTNSLGANVTTDILTGYSAKSKVFKFLTVNGSNLSFSEINSDTYLDWPGTSDLPYEHGFITGNRIRGDLIKKFQTNYLTIITEEIEDGSCYVQGVWDYASHYDSGRYTNPQQVYRHRLLRNYQQSRLVIRGNGRSLQFKFFGEAGKPFVIVGWAGFETSDGMP